LSPDTRQHRGAHPADAKLFGADQLPKLRVAVSELSWLLSRGYNITSSLKLVGDRHGLRERQRLAVRRSSCSEEDKKRRQQHCVGLDQLRDQPVVIDGFNLMITVEAALSNGPLLVGADGCIRDLSSVHGSYRSVDETNQAIRMIAEELEDLGVASVLWLLDRPVSNSGRLASRINELAADRDWRWTVDLVFNPDSVITSSSSIAVTSDATILDQVDRWIDLKSYLITKRIPEAWLIDLSK
jgi:hypothetical protein